MKNILILLIFLIPVTIFAQTVPPFHNISSERILVIYNINDIDDNNNGIADSKELALYYQEKRNVPDSNLLGLNISVSNYYYNNNQWTVFWDEVVLPIRNKLSELGDTSIYYLLLCDRIPYKLVLPVSTNSGRSLDNALSSLNNLGTSTTPNFPTYYAINPFYESSPTDFTDKGSFDHTYMYYGSNMYLVSRLIGTDVRMNKNLIDMALYGDKYIYFDQDPEYYNGIAYADHRFGQYNDSTLQAGYHYVPGTYNDFDKDAAYIKFYYEEAGLVYKQEANETEIGQVAAVFTDGSPADSAVQAILYGGWYNYNTYHDAWEWLPGSYACDLNSNSGASIRNGGGKFLSGSFANGLTCGTGCVGEPYLDGHSQPDIFMHYFLKGYNFIEAAYHAEPKFKWQGITVGDPLYNPYKVGKVPVKDSLIEITQITFNYVSLNETHILVDYNTSVEHPELVKAKLVWGDSINYSDTIDFEDIYFAHHQFELTGLNDTSTYYFKICVIDPVGNVWCSADETFTTSGSSTLISSAFTADNNIICDSGIVYFTNLSSGNNSYVWQLNGVTFDTAINTHINFSEEGYYQISLIADNGMCQDTSFQELIVSSPDPEIIQFNDSLVCDIYSSYQWYFNGDLIPGAIYQHFIASVSGEYYVSVINEYGCQAFSDIINVVTIGLDETDNLLLSTFRVFPNPFSNSTTIEFFIVKSSLVSIDVYDIYGSKVKHVLSEEMGSGSHRVLVNLNENLSSGIYFVNLIIGNKIYRQKIIGIK